MRNKKLLSTINLLAFAFLIYASYLFRTRQSSFDEKAVPIFNPAPYAFGIWGLIFLALIIWIINGYFVKYDIEAMYRKIFLWFVACMVFSGAAVLVPTTISPFIIAVALVISLIIYGITDSFNIGKRYRIPFSLLGGWLSVATIVDISESLKFIGFTSIFGIGEIGWTIILLIVGSLIAIAFTIIKNDILYPLVFVWGYIAIGVENKDIKSVLYTVIATSILILIGITYKIISKRKCRA